MTLTHERLDQKRRTRGALLEGARRLMARGEPVTVAAAAAEMGVSRPTAYRYFSDPQLLALEAGLTLAVPDYDALTAGLTGLRGKLLAIVLAIFDLALAHEVTFRRFIARTLDAIADDPSRAATLRPAWRISYYRRALSEHPPLPRAEELVAELTAITGFEALIALKDIGRYDGATARSTVARLAGHVLDGHFGKEAP